jgi:hypothetical protein
MEPAPDAPGHHAAADGELGRRTPSPAPVHAVAEPRARRTRTPGDYDLTEMGLSAVPWWWSKTASQDTQNTARVWSRSGFPTVAGCRTGRSSRRAQPAQTAAPQLMQMPTAGACGRPLMAQSKQFTVMLPFSVRSLATPAGTQVEASEPSRLARVLVAGWPGPYGHFRIGPRRRHSRYPQGSVEQATVEL